MRINAAESENTAVGLNPVSVPQVGVLAAAIVTLILGLGLGLGLDLKKCQNKGAGGGGGGCWFKARFCVRAPLLQDVRASSLGDAL